MGIIGIITKKRNPKGCFRLGFAPIMFIRNKRIKLILHEGTTKLIKGRTKIKAGEIMFEFPDCVVCHADSFFLGKPIPILSIHDHLMGGKTYFILPLDRLPVPQEANNGSTRGTLLSTASLYSLGSPNGGLPSAKSPPNSMVLKLLNNDPFEYIKDKDGRVLMIKVVPELITRIITTNCGVIIANDSDKGVSAKLICSTPELQKQYEQLVRAKDQAWSPKLETITEHKNNIKFSPSRLIRLEWRQRERYS